MPTLLTSGLVIEHLAFKVRNYRHIRRAIVEGKLKLTGLTKLAMDGRAEIDGLTADYRAFIEKSKAHRADVRGLAAQIGDMDTDLTSSVNILGNSVASSNNGAERQVITAAEVGAVPAAVTLPEIAKANAEPVSDAPGTTQMHPAPSASNFVGPR